MNPANKLTKDELKILRKLFLNKKLKRNEILSILDYNQVTIEVKEGILRKFVIKDGKEKTLDLFFPGDYILTPNFKYRPIHNYKVQALRKSVINIMNMKAYNEIKDKSINFLKMDIKVIEAALTQNMYRLETFQLMNATERYLELINRNPKILQRVPLIHIASYLGINNASLSKIRASLK